MQFLVGSSAAPSRRKQLIPIPETELGAKKYFKKKPQYLGGAPGSSRELLEADRAGDFFDVVVDIDAHPEGEPVHAARISRGLGENPADFSGKPASGTDDVVGRLDRGRDPGGGEGFGRCLGRHEA